MSYCFFAPQYFPLEFWICCVIPLNFMQSGMQTMAPSYNKAVTYLLHIYECSLIPPPKQPKLGLAPLIVEVSGTQTTSHTPGGTPLNKC